MQSAEAIATLEELGTTQAGLVTTGQAEQYGVSRVTLGRLRDRGLIHQARRGVYSLPSATGGPLQDLHAAWLSTTPTELGEQRLNEPDLVVSHISAAQVHGLGDLIPSSHEFTSATRRRSSQPDVRIHRGDLPYEDVTIADGMPVTSIPRTVADIAGGGVDLDHLAGVVRDALSWPNVRPRTLSQRLDRAAERHGFADGNALLEACLERTGLPAVAENLADTNGALVRTLGGDQFRRMLEATFGDTLAKHFGTAGAAHTIAHWRDQNSEAFKSLRAQQFGDVVGKAAEMAAIRQSTLEALRSPALEAAMQSVTTELMRGVRLGSQSGIDISRYLDARNRSIDSETESNGNEAVEADDASGPEDVAEGEAGQEGA